MPEKMLESLNSVNIPLEIYLIETEIDTDLSAVSSLLGFFLTSSDELPPLHKTCGFAVVYYVEEGYVHVCISKPSSRFKTLVPLFLIKICWAFTSLSLWRKCIYWGSLFSRLGIKFCMGPSLGSSAIRSLLANYFLRTVFPWILGINLSKSWWINNDIIIVRLKISTFF